LEQTAEHVFVWVERSEDPYIVALDKQRGETTWKSPGLKTTSWSSPRLVPTRHGDHLVLSGGGKLAGLNPATGERLWEFSDIANNTTCTPMPAGEGKFLIGASDGRGANAAGKGAASNGLIEIEQQPDGKFN